MDGSTRPGRTNEAPVVPLGLLVVGLGAFCGAVVYPVQQAVWHRSPTALLAVDVVLPTEVVTVVLVLVALGVVTTTYSLVLLVGRL
jgi:hypothetical protein